MITIFRSNGLWSVGVVHNSSTSTGGNSWTPLRDCVSADEAMAWMSYLNGGEYPQLRRSAVQETKCNYDADNT
jgi:hypothetical protein